MDFSFIHSVRFWKLFVVGAMTGLYLIFPDNVILKALDAMFAVWLGGSVVVKTVDKANK